MKVEIYSYSFKEPKVRLIGTWTLAPNGHAVCDSAFDQESAEINGIMGKGYVLFPRDGEAFLRGLPREYAGRTYVGAVVVEDDAAPASGK